MSSRPRRNVIRPVRYRESSEAEYSSPLGRDQGTKISPEMASRLDTDDIRNLRTVTRVAVAEEERRRKLPPAAFPTKEWPDPIQQDISPVDEENLTKGVAGRLDSVVTFPPTAIDHGCTQPISHGYDEEMGMFKYKGKTIDSKGRTRHGILKVLRRVEARQNNSQEARQRQKENARKQKEESRWTPELRLQQAAYERDWERRYKYVSRHGTREELEYLQRPNLLESPADRFAFEDEMTTSSEDEANVVEEPPDNGADFHKLHPTLQWGIIQEIEDDVQGRFGDKLPYHASRMVLGIRKGGIDAVEMKKEEIRDTDETLPSHEDIANAKEFLRARELPISLLEVYDSDSGEES